MTEAIMKARLEALKKIQAGTLSAMTALSGQITEVEYWLAELRKEPQILKGVPEKKP